MNNIFVNKFNNRLKNISSSICSVIVFTIVFALGGAIRGEWIHLVSHMLRAYRVAARTSLDSNETAAGLEAYYLQNLPYYVVMSSVVSYGFYFAVGGFLHWYYYVKRRHLAHEWKCQPNKWLNPTQEREEILLGCYCLAIGSILSSLIACYVNNGGPSKVYYDVKDHGCVWLFLSIPVTFLYLDYSMYLQHRLYHLPVMYKHFHKMHHAYKHPTAFGALAIHPVEFVHAQLIMNSPMVLYPIHWSVLVSLLLYYYSQGLIDHSGVNFKAYWWQIWQPDSTFHDDHHQYFTVNFGLNCLLWDKLHGTDGRKKTINCDDIHVKKVEDVSESEIKERLSEKKLS